MAQINKPDEYFNTVLYTGNGGTNAITGVGFQPDWVWIKNRPDAKDHQIYDSVRGTTKVIGSDRTSAEATVSNGLTAFGSDGFTVGADSNVNDNGDSHVSWNWLASNTTASNTDGSITSTVSANTTSGFSVVSYTGTGANATVGHGLGSAPSMIIVKNRSAVKDWVIYHKSLGNTKFLEFTTSGEQTASNRWNNTTPTNSVFSLGSDNGANGSGNSHIAYCFAEKKGFSKFGSYTGNGNADGPFIYTGFRPAFVMTKRTDGASDWAMMDNKRPNEFNVVQNYLKAQANDAEQTDDSFNIDILSNGWKARYNNGNYNASGGSYIYMAFAENPLVGTNNIPATAR